VSNKVVRSKASVACGLILILYSLASMLPPSYAAKSEGHRRSASELIGRGRELLADSAPRAALETAKRGLEAARSSGDDQAMTESLLLMAQIHIELRELEEAMNLAKQALAAARLAGDRRQEAQAINLTGDAYYYQNEYARALEYFRAALQMKRELGDREGEANALKDAGITCRGLGRYDEALELLNSALEIFQEQQCDFPVVVALMEMATSYTSVGAYHLAVDAYEQSLRIAREKNYSGPIFNANTRLGYFYLELNEGERALAHFREALSIAERLRPARDQAWAQMGIGNALAALGRTDAAIEATRRAIRLNSQSGSARQVADNFRDLGFMHLERDPRAAADYFLRALSIHEKYGNRLVWSPYTGLGQAYRRMNDPARAISYFEKAIELLESLRGQLASEQHRAAFSGKYHDVYQQLIEVLVEQHDRDPGAGHDRRAFEISERIKGRAMLESIAEARQESGRGGARKLDGRSLALNKRIAELQKRLLQGDVAKDERRQIVEELGDSERELDALAVEVKRGGGDYSPPGGIGSLTPDEARALLDDRAAVVAYQIMRNRAVAFVITADSFHVRGLESSPAVLTACVENYVDLVARETEEGWQEISRRLYRELVAPLRKLIPSSVNRLVVVPDGVLHYLPFESLIEDDGSDPPHGSSGAAPRYLLEDYTISYSPSVSLLAELRAAAAPPEDDRADLALFADPDLARLRPVSSGRRGGSEWARVLYANEGLEIEPIPFSAAEARAIIRYGGKGSSAYIGREASERHAKTDRLDRFRVIHFATHGLVSQQRPARSALVLSSSADDGEDGFLQAREIYNLKLNSDLVVLSACQTARGRLLAGEGVEGLAQAFFYAGAKSVVASLWDINDRRTTAFMERFYLRLSEGLPKAEALRAAKLDLLREGREADPRHWAAFVLIGEPEGTVRLNRPPGPLGERGWLAVASGIILGALAITLLVRRRLKKRVL
jgi:CHAT domain-containing protein/tetratricopeptide (TPR) repeat protein